jgi:hypothetical protein
LQDRQEPQTLEAVAVVLVVLVTEQQAVVTLVQVALEL